MRWRTNGLRRKPNGYYYWRRVHPVTGKRRERATKTRNERIACRKAAQWDEELEREAAGLKNYDWARRKIADLVPAFLADWGADLSPEWVKQREAELWRAIRELKLVVVADLDDLGALDRRLKRLGQPDSVLSRSYQQPLRTFSKWLAENNRVTERDLLGNWKKIPYEPRRTRQAVLPEDMARSFLAASEIDQARNRHPLRPVLTALLATAPRIGALISRDVDDLVERTHRGEARYRIDYGEGCKKKRRGKGALDPASWAEIKSAVGDRTKGPLLLSPKGARLSKERVLDAWREAHCLGLVTQHFPAYPYRERMLIAASLLSGTVKLHKGGRSPVKPQAVESRLSLKKRIEGAFEQLHDDWLDRRRVDVHSFRMIHRTWAEAAGVPAVLIDLQLGHAVADEGSLNVLKAVVAGRTGRKHYLDDQSELLDPTPSAVAVRGLLDEALIALLGETERSTASA